MEKTTLISEMHKFHFGSKIVYTDGEEGVLTHVGFDSASRRLTSIGIRQGRFFGKTVYLPFEVVTNATADGINLGIARADLATTSTAEPVGVILDQKSSVQLAGGSAKGVLLLVATHPQSGGLAYIVAQHLRANGAVLLQQQYVTKLEQGIISVSLPETTLKTLPPYRSDSELQQEVENILFDLTPLHVDFKGMTVRVLDSVLYLDGNISSSLRGDIVQDQALGVQGLLEIKNRLIGDDKLAGDLAMALAHDERTRDLPIGVYPRLGDVRFSGSVHSEEQKKAVSEIAASFPGVCSVSNDLSVDPSLDMIRVMASPGTAKGVDLIPGKYIRHTK